MTRFALKRLAAAVFVLFSISVLVFVIFFATPGVDRRLASRAATQIRPRSPRCGRSSGSTSRCPFATP